MVRILPNPRKGSGTGSPKYQLNLKQSIVFGEKVSLREIGRIFFVKIRNFKLWKMPKLLNFWFPEG